MATSTAEIAQWVASRWGRPARLTAVGLVALLLLIPLEMVQSVVRERYLTYQTVVADIAGSWSGDQLLAGPILAVPYIEQVEVRDEFITPQGQKKATRRWESRHRRALLLPDNLTIDGLLVPEERRRGIYRVQVYTAELSVSGSFRNLRAAVESLVPSDRLESIDWPSAVVVFGLSDPRGIVEADRLRVGGEPVRPRPGTTLGEAVARGFHVPVAAAVGEELAFELPLTVRGSGGLRFLPLGASTRASLRSGWPHPSFIGEVLPAQREIGAEGFSAEWTIPLLNRSYPQVWRAGTEVAIDEIAAGVRLFEPVALYDKVTRAVKYGLLFTVLTFLTLGLIELVLGIRLSLVQFLLIGVALALFFLLLIALAEHMGFGLAYLLASSTAVIINSTYCGAILRRRSTATVVGAVLASIYAVLYTILRAEDFALLGGTVLLMAALAVTMYFTRRIHEPTA